MSLTIKDIANKAGVSITTVSKILNNKADDISDPTKKRVMQIVKKENFTLNSVARSLKTKKTHIMGLIIPDITNPFFPEIARGAEDAASELGYSLIICNTDDSYEKERKYINILAQKMVDGVIFIPSLTGKFHSDVFTKRKLPLVVLDRNFDYSCIWGKVMVDNFCGAYEAVSYLISKGHKDILFLSAFKEHKNSQERYEGYKKALEDNNIEFNEQNVVYGKYKSQFGYESIKNFVKEKKRFTAVFCANDMIAVGAIQALKELSLKVPDDVGVVGYDDIQMARYTDPPLTTVSQPKYDMGRLAVEMLAELIKKPKKKGQLVQTLESKLIVRKSV